MIEVRDLRKSFNHGKLEVLKGITKKIETGEKVAVIGPSGSGKSTFLRCLNLLEEPTGGEVFQPFSAYVGDEKYNACAVEVKNCFFR